MKSIFPLWKSVGKSVEIAVAVLRRSFLLDIHQWRSALDESDRSGFARATLLTGADTPKKDIGSIPLHHSWGRIIPFSMLLYYILKIYYICVYVYLCVCCEYGRGRHLCATLYQWRSSHQFRKSNSIYQNWRQSPSHSELFHGPEFLIFLTMKIKYIYKFYQLIIKIHNFLHCFINSMLTN